MTMTTTLQQAVRPLFIMCFIIGLGVYPLKEFKPKIKCIIYLNILYSVIVWSIFWYSFYYLIISSHSMILLYRSNILIIVGGMNMIIAITSAIFNIYHEKRFKIFMKKLAIVDNTLEELGTSNIYQKIHIWSKGVVIAWIIYSFVLNIYDALWWVGKEETAFWAYILAHMANHCYHINVLMDSIFIIFLWHLHLELCRIAHELNGMFGMQMTFEMASYLFYLTAVCHYLYGVLTKKIQEEKQMAAWFINCFWTFIFILRLCVINYFCENVNIKANKISKLIYQLTNTLRYANIKKEIFQFTLQIMHHPLRFTGMGLFYFGNNFLRKFCMRILTFMIIILQMSGN